MFSEDLPSAKAWHIFNKFSSKIRAIFQNNGYSESFVLKQLNIFLITYRKWVSTMTAYLKRRAFFSIRVFFHGHWQLTGEQGKRGDHLLFHSTTSTAHEHSDIYLQLCTWDDYHIFLIVMLVFTRLLVNEIYHLIELLFDWLMMWCWFLFVCLLNLFQVLLQL